ncbi:hypothetical protein NAPIS_ORF01056 [Vairimorpha apis BRL 01]|uniref:Uncharacterized protein n=1 Tax=Vairimorpha apis BRL 01 TaxID=1037528 RepID=T0LA90_9MICR|nr:hypothetical protein NAPIS_ORF01056 [Vairimorpha apis BRL 01]
MILKVQKLKSDETKKEISPNINISKKSENTSKKEDLKSSKDKNDAKDLKQKTEEIKKDLTNQNQKNGKDDSKNKPIKYESDDSNKENLQKESIWNDLFNINEKNKDKNDTKDDQSKKRLGNNRNDKNSTSNINKQNNSSSSITSKSVSNSTNSQKVENPKKAIESIVFIGNKDKELNNISNQKGETSVNDLLYVLKNMPGKVNINKEGKEVYIEGDFFTPKEKDLKGNEYKFHGILRAKSDTNKQ